MTEVKIVVSRRRRRRARHHPAAARPRGRSTSSPPAGPAPSTAARPTPTSTASGSPTTPTRKGFSGTLHEALAGADVFIGVSGPNILGAEQVATMADGRHRVRHGQPGSGDRPDGGGQARRRGGHRAQRLPQPDQQRAGLPGFLPRAARRRRPATSPPRCWWRPPRPSPTAWARTSSTPATSCRASSTRASPRRSPQRSWPPLAASV